jgi:hypothetical protein
MKWYIRDICVKKYDKEWLPVSNLTENLPGDNKLPQVYIDKHKNPFILWHGFTDRKGSIYIAIPGSGNK